MRIRETLLSVISMLLVCGAAYAADAETVSVPLENMIRNGGFEEKSLGWEVLKPQSGKWEYDSSIVKSGSQSLRLSPIKSAYPDNFALQTYMKGLKGKYYLEAFFRIDEAYTGKRPVISLSIYPEKPGAFERRFLTVGLPENYKAGEWAKVSQVFDVPAEATLYVAIFAYGESGSAWLDDIFLAPTEGDADVPGDRRSRSLKLTGGNMLVNSDFERGRDNWDVPRRTGSMEIDKEVKHGGTTSARLQPTASTYPDLFVVQQRCILEAGEYYFEAYCKLSDDYAGQSPAFHLNANPLKENAFPRVYTSLSAPLDAEPGKWIKVSGMIKSPAPASSYIQIVPYGGSGSVWIDDLRLVAVEAK